MPLTPVFTPSTPFSMVCVPTAPSTTLVIATLKLRPTSPMPNRVATTFPTLNYLIDKVELVSHINIPTQGDATNAEAKIDNIIAEAEGTRVATSSSHSLRQRNEFFDLDLKASVPSSLEIQELMIGYLGHIAYAHIQVVLGLIQSMDVFRCGCVEDEWIAIMAEVYWIPALIDLPCPDDGSSSPSSRLS
ncbi:hypothetical protein Ancab_001424 [Ancistrocladus abbreviatus]